MNNRCNKCGSQNHRSFDCLKPYNGWREKEGIIASPEAESAPKTNLGRSKAVLAAIEAEQPRENLLPNEKGYAGAVPLRFRKNWPFLRESTRREMDDRIAAVESRRLAEKPAAKLKEKRVEEKPIKLPKAQKKQSQDALF